MSHCLDEGTLRAYLDQQLAPATQQAVAAHLAQCAACRATAEQQAAQAAQAAHLLAVPTAPDHAAAWQRFQQTTVSQPTPTTGRPTPMKQPFWKNITRPAVAAVAAVLLIAGLLTLPPVQALADQLLQIFRVQQVLFVPVSEERISELENLEFDGSTLFVSAPEMLNNPAEPMPIADAAAAEAVVGYLAREPVTFTGNVTSTELLVTDRAEFSFQVDVAGVRALLAALNITDIDVPDALGEAPITGVMEPAVLAAYSGADFEIMVAQGNSPQLSLPDDVDLQQMGVVLLRILGMEANQAQSLAASVDWSSTLVFPFPANVENIQQVTVNGNAGMLVDATDEEGESGYYLYWQDGAKFYNIVARGSVSRDALLDLAASMY